MNKPTGRSLTQLIDSCRKKDRKSQEELYVLFYNYAMSVCLRYSRERDEAIEIVNDGFMKIFNNLDKYNHSHTFKAWLRRVMINASIDYYRRNEKHYHNVDISYAKHEGVTAQILSKISEKEIIGLIQLLPPSYRMVFNLFVIEGYKHGEIAHKMGISIGTSKSNLAVARTKLKKMVNKMEERRKTAHG